MNSMMPRSQRQRLETEENGDVTIVMFPQQELLSECVINDVFGQLFDLVEGFGRRKLLLNFSNVATVHELVYGKLVALRHKVLRASGKLVVCCVRSQVQEALGDSLVRSAFTLARDEYEGLMLFC